MFEKVVSKSLLGVYENFARSLLAVYENFCEIFACSLREFLRVEFENHGQESYMGQKKSQLIVIPGHSHNIKASLSWKP